MILACGCYCGSTDNLIRNFLKRNNYRDWATIKIVKGKDKTRAMLGSLPRRDEIIMLDNFVQSASKWAVVIGIDDNACRWADIAHGGPKAAIDAGFIVAQFA